MDGFALSGLHGSRRASMLPLGNSVSWSLGHSRRSSFHSNSLRASRTVRSELISSTISLLSWQRLSFWSSLSTLGTNFAQIFRIFSSSRIIVCTVTTLTSNCARIVSIDIRRSLCMKLFIWPNQIWCSDFFTPPTPLIIPHRLPAFLESLMPLKNWWSIHARCSKKQSKAIPYVSVAFFQV